MLRNRCAILKPVYENALKQDLFSAHTEAVRRQALHEKTVRLKRR